MMHLFKFDKEVAGAVASELMADNPQNKWSTTYIQRVIEVSCSGNRYYSGHHGAFDAYLRKFEKAQHVCDYCDTVFVGDYHSSFCCLTCCDNYARS